MAEKTLQNLRERLERKYLDADFEILGPEPDILYVHMNDSYDNSLALTRDRVSSKFTLINLQHLRSESFKAHPNWNETIETSELSALEEFVDHGYQRVIKKNNDFEEECEEALSKFSMTGGMIW